MGGNECGNEWKAPSSAAAKRPTLLPQQISAGIVRVEATMEMSSSVTAGARIGAFLACTTALLYPGHLVARGRQRPRLGRRRRRPSLPPGPHLVRRPLLLARDPELFLEDDRLIVH